MMPTERVTYTTPDGVERELRFTLGARKRIAEKFGMPDIKGIFATFGDGALPDLAYAMMFDAHGKPPALDIVEFAENTDDPLPLLAALMSAATKGRTPKNELEALLRKAQQMEVEKLIGSTFGASPDSASDSQLKNSGGSPNPNLTHSATDTAIASAQPTTAPAS